MRGRGQVLQELLRQQQTRCAANAPGHPSTSTTTNPDALLSAVRRQTEKIRPLSTTVDRLTVGPDQPQVVTYPVTTQTPSRFRPEEPTRNPVCGRPVPIPRPDLRPPSPPSPHSPPHLILHVFRPPHGSRPRECQAYAQGVREAFQYLDPDRWPVIGLRPRTLSESEDEFENQGYQPPPPEETVTTLPPQFAAALHLLGIPAPTPQEWDWDNVWD